MQRTRKNGIERRKTGRDSKIDFQKPTTVRYVKFSLVQ